MTSSGSTPTHGTRAAGSKDATLRDEQRVEATQRDPLRTGLTKRLSLPQRQKLALARAILKRPEILILYDATGSLDPGDQLAILDARCRSSPDGP